jgi:hypothetical protein
MQKSKDDEFGDLDKDDTESLYDEFEGDEWLAKIDLEMRIEG